MIKYLAIAAALAVGGTALAQTPAPTGVQPGSPSSPEAGETSDRTPDKATQTPQAQQDTAGDKTSDRSQNKDVKVQHQPGAAGTGGSENPQKARRQAHLARAGRQLLQPHRPQTSNSVCLG